jgi:hypothetical protein
MQLRRARLCLDCEEVHDVQQCPTCASESFAYLSRWVPAPERRSQPRAIQPPRTTTPKKVIGYGVVGLGIMGIARLLMLGRKQIEHAASKRNFGELK